MNPQLSEILFGISGLAGLVFALLTVTRRNPVYSALHLILFFISMFVNLLLLQATFLAFMQLLVYAGAIMVLYVFVIMLINPRENTLPVEGGGLDRAFALVVSLLLFIALFVVVGRSEKVRHYANFSLLPDPPATLLEKIPGHTDAFKHGSMEALGYELFTRHLFVFELTSLLILIAIVGSVHLSMQRRRSAETNVPRKVNVIPEQARRQAPRGEPHGEERDHAHV